MPTLPGADSGGTEYRGILVAAAATDLQQPGEALEGQRVPVQHLGMARLPYRQHLTQYVLLLPVGSEKSQKCENRHIENMVTILVIYFTSYPTTIWLRWLV